MCIRDSREALVRPAGRGVWRWWSAQKAEAVAEALRILAGGVALGAGRNEHVDPIAIGHESDQVVALSPAVLGDGFVTGALMDGLGVLAAHARIAALGIGRDDLGEIVGLGRVRRAPFGILEHHNAVDLSL